jgi:hypothetical protein
MKEEIERAFEDFKFDFVFGHWRGGVFVGANRKSGAGEWQRFCGETTLIPAKRATRHFPVLSATVYTIEKSARDAIERAKKAKEFKERTSIMKKAFISSLLALGLVACGTPFDHTPNPGGLGEYGFTYDLGGTPSPFIDTSYRPLTPADLAAPTIVVVTNYRTPPVVYKEAPEIGVTKYAGSTPASVYSSGAAPIVEAAGANRAGNAGAAAAAGTAPGTAGYAPGGYYYGGGGGTIVGPITNVTQTVTNVVNTNNLATNGTNGIVINNTNGINLSFTNTNALAGGTNISTNTDLTSTNGAINEAAGAQSTNRFGEPTIPTAPPQATPLQQTPQQLQLQRQQQLQQQMQIQRQQQLQQLQQQAIQRQQQAVQQSQSAAPPAAPNAGQTSGNAPNTSGQNTSGNQNAGTSGTSGSSSAPSGATGGTGGGGGGGQTPR